MVLCLLFDVYFIVFGQDPELMAAFSDPEIMAALQDGRIFFRLIMFYLFSVVGFYFNLDGLAASGLSIVRVFM